MIDLRLSHLRGVSAVHDNPGTKESNVKSGKWIIPLILVATTATAGQQPAAVQQATLAVKPVSGQTLTLGAQDFTKLPRVKVTAKDHEGKNHEYAGVKLRDILTQAGVATGNDLRGKEMTDYVVAEASDGYRVVFSLAELDPDLGNTLVIVAQSVDGQPLGAKEGPLRLVVPGDKRQARWVRMVTGISVMRVQ
jgi:DMSO/TMAO reductase YedYZ molybdopterin-dependent catalytic subunit